MLVFIPMNKIDQYKNLWIEKYRPKKLDDLVLDSKLRNDILKWGEAGEIPHLLFYGNAGGGKSTLAKVIVNEVLDCQYLYINGSEQSGVDVVRGLIIDFAERKSIDGKLKVVIIDECEGMSSVGSGSGSSAQQAMRNVMEEHSHLARFILTSNYLNKIIDPIESRCIAYHIVPPMKGFILRCIEVLDAEKVEYRKPEIISYVKQYYPDLRKAVNAIQRDTLDGKLVITKKKVEHKKIVVDLFKHILQKKDTHALRTLMIENGSKFSNDYRELLSDMFNYVETCNVTDDVKRNYLIELSSGLHKHEMVADKEINAYATLLRMY